jgi:Pyridoxamine 5'-phosphate oxidase (EC 1.4.3.5)
MVLLRAFDDHGFVFFTNYGSRKALELETNPQAALCFYWYWIEQQVRVEGKVIRATREESDAYFQSRPRGSQIGAWASKQSQPLAARGELDERYAAVAREYGDGPIPRPEFWGGYRLIPHSVEFWTAGTFRLHERRLFTRVADGWREQWLYP